MQLTLYSEYSLRVPIYLAVASENLIKIHEIADGYRISKNHLMKVVNNLAQLGYVESRRGKNGGLRLARAPNQINIGELVRKTEENPMLAECFDRRNGNCRIDGICTLKGVLGESLQAFMAVLDNHTLADVVVETEAIRAGFGLDLESQSAVSSRIRPPRPGNRHLDAEAPEPWVCARSLRRTAAPVRSERRRWRSGIFRSYWIGKCS